MSEQVALLNVDQSQDWLQVRLPEIQRILGTLATIQREVVGDDLTNLNRLHTVGSHVRERQQYVQTYLSKAMDMQSEVERRKAVAVMKYKDAMGLAFTKYADVISPAKGYEEKELRLRAYVPEIKEKEQWEALCDQMERLVAQVKLVYDDLSKDAMSVSVARDVVQSQIYTGEIKLRVKDLTVENLIKDSMQKEMPRGNGNILDI